MKIDKVGKYIYVGKYDFGLDVVGLVAELGTGDGHVWCSSAHGFKAMHPKVEGMHYFSVGLQGREWWNVYSTLLHEANEFALSKQGLRFESSETMRKSHASYLFVFDHEQFAEAITQTASFLDQAHSDLKKLYLHFKRKSK